MPNPIPKPPREQIEAKKDLDDRMRGALSNNELWAELTATPEGAAEVALWLSTTKMAIETQLSVRRAKFENWAAGEFHTDYGKRHGEYQTWRASALHMLSLCKQRAQELKIRESSTSRKTRAEEYKEVVIQLAEAIRGFERGELDAPGLIGHLDVVDLPAHGGGQPVNLRTCLSIRDFQQARKA